MLRVAPGRNWSREGGSGGPAHPKDAGTARERTSKTREGAKAFAASDVANRTGLPRDHTEAHELHRDAEESARKAGDNTAADEHGSFANYHEKRAEPSFSAAVGAKHAASNATSDASRLGTREAHERAANAHRDAAAIIKARGGDHKPHERQAAKHEEKAKSAGPNLKSWAGKKLGDTPRQMLGSGKTRGGADKYTMEHGGRYKSVTVPPRD